MLEKKREETELSEELVAEITPDSVEAAERALRTLLLTENFPDEVAQHPELYKAALQMLLQRGRPSVPENVTIRHSLDVMLRGMFSQIGLNVELRYEGYRTEENLIVIDIILPEKLREVVSSEIVTKVTRRKQFFVLGKIVEKSRQVVEEKVKRAQPAKYLGTLWIKRPKNRESIDVGLEGENYLFHINNKLNSTRVMPKHVEQNKVWVITARDKERFELLEPVARELASQFPDLKIELLLTGEREHNQPPKNTDSYDGTY